MLRREYLSEHVVEKVQPLLRQFVELLMKRLQDWAKDWAEQNVLIWKRTHEPLYTSHQDLRAAFSKELEQRSNLSKSDRVIIWKVVFSISFSFFFFLFLFSFSFLLF